MYRYSIHHVVLPAFSPSSSRRWQPRDPQDLRAHILYKAVVALYHGLEDAVLCYYCDPRCRRPLTTSGSCSNSGRTATRNSLVFTLTLLWSQIRLNNSAHRPVSPRNSSCIMFKNGRAAMYKTAKRRPSCVLPSTLAGLLCTFFKHRIIFFASLDWSHCR